MLTLLLNMEMKMKVYSFSISITGNVQSTLYEDVVYNHDGTVVINGHSFSIREGSYTPTHIACVKQIYTDKDMQQNFLSENTTNQNETKATTNVKYEEIIGNILSMLYSLYCFNHACTI